MRVFLVGTVLFCQFRLISMYVPMLIHVFAFFSSVWSLLLLCDSDFMVWEKRNYDPAMFEKVFRPLLLGYIGRYIKDIPIDQLKIDIWKGIFSFSPIYIYFYFNLNFKLCLVFPVDKAILHFGTLLGHIWNILAFALA